LIAAVDLHFADLLFGVTQVYGTVLITTSFTACELIKGQLECFKYDVEIEFFDRTFVLKVGK